MAGDWIKIQHVTPDKPEIMRIAEILNVSENEVLGGLVRFWAWCDFQSRDGHAIGVTRISLSRLTGVTGIYDAMVQVGWLIEDSHGVHVPHFDYHLSENAKGRGLAQKRKQKHRSNNVTQESRLERDKNGTREEKRREDNTKPPNPLAGGRNPAAKAVLKIRKRDMENLQRLDAWILKNLPPPHSENLRIKVLACAIHSMRNANRNPTRMFLAMLEKGMAGEWTIPDEDIQAASRQIVKHKTQNPEPESISEILRRRNGT